MPKMGRVEGKTEDLENFRENRGKTASPVAILACAKALRLEVIHPGFQLLVQPC